MKLGSGARIAVLVVGTIIVGAAFLFYEELRRARSNDFPFQFEPLFLHGLLLLLIGVVAVIMISVALTGGRGTTVLASLLIGVPSAALAVAPYLIVVQGWDFVPDRLVGDGFHQVGMLGLGAALALLVVGLAGFGSDRRAVDADGV
jgi:hypothetical protein